MTTEATAAWPVVIKLQLGRCCLQKSRFDAVLNKMADELETIMDSLRFFVNHNYNDKNILLLFGSQKMLLQGHMDTVY